MEPPDRPEGRYRLAASGEEAHVFHVITPYSIELRAAWKPDDVEHHPLNEVLAHISVLELDHLVAAAASGTAFVVDPLDDIVPRPGWELATQDPSNPTHYSIQQLDTALVRSGPRRELLLLLELTARATLAAHQGVDTPHEWVLRLRQAYPKLVDALDGVARFEKADDY